MLMQSPPSQRFSIISHSLKSLELPPRPPRPRPCGQSWANSWLESGGQGWQGLPGPQARPRVQQQDWRVMLAGWGARQ